ncbi:hypothetical protein BU16DRAFT_533024 [Lophium mytilinum]|uniref:F-box domain-containing protein n=1 Tax=Lophium mytilinum TaxID=390894 RepID=A0A6A6RE20_9PEZI|nr:hypothetical protein BU16DRAFT_533024 [Lophium mytilinum]
MDITLHQVDGPSASNTRSRVLKRKRKNDGDDNAEPVKKKHVELNQPKKPTATTISDIPAEVFSIICDHINDVRDIFSLRLSNKEMRDKSQYSFGRNWFRAIKFSLHPISLAMMDHISKHPQYAKNVERVIVGPELVATIPREYPGRTIDIPQRETPEMMQNRLKLRDQGLELVKQDFGIPLLITYLARFPNLKLLDLEEDPCPYPRKHDGLWGKPTPNACGTKRLYELTGCQYSDCRGPVTAARVQRHAYIFNRLCDSISGVDLKGVSVGFGGTETFAYVFGRTNIALDEIRGSHLHFKFRDFVPLEPRPRQLSRVHYAVGHYVDLRSASNSFDRLKAGCEELTLEWVPVSRPARDPVHLPLGPFSALKKLALGGGGVRFLVDEMINFLHAHRQTVTHLRIYDCCFVSGNVLSLVEEIVALPQLVELELEEVQYLPGEPANMTTSTLVLKGKEIQERLPSLFILA